MDESKGHSLLGLYLCLVALQKVRTIVLTTCDEAVREVANKIIAISTADIKVKGELWNQPDASFALLGDAEPTFIVEVAWSQSQQDVEDKAENYIRGTHGKVQVVIVLNVLYPDLEEAVVSLLVATHDDGFRWEQRRKVIHSDHLEQPDGVVGLYLSDFCGPAGLPAAYCRPPAGVSRNPVMTISYRVLGAIFRAARHAQYPKKYQLEQEDHDILSSLLPQDSEELRHHLQEAKCQREEAER
ncbi:hypothetical protein B0H67DRAFT_586331 [Lasiosphaeris hirsuta]|uniref:Uncharacterized protein n=1 Tax=Lasiosphaeris hirsuta TaxID=260670 RepID=A0AA40DQH7_9PEZI|nr:hypothetical protein B0H67DRAFT_586331 [Lasiosphaeris hirsuta]